MRFVFAILFVLGLQFINAQEYSYKFEDEIKMLRQDANGFIYLVSNQSICKFDGEEVHSTCLHLDKQITDAAILTEDKYYIASTNTFLVYNKQSKIQEFQFDEIITSLELSGDNLYIGTSGSNLHLFSAKTNKLSKLNLKGFINDIISVDNNIYIITDTEIIKLNESNEIHNRAKLPGFLPQQIVPFATNKLAILMNSGQIIFTNPNLQTTSIYNPKEFQPTEIAGNRGLLYAIDQNHLKKWDNNEFKIIKKGSFNNLIQVQSQLFTTDKNTIESINIISEFYNTKNVFSLYSDKEFIWLGQEGKISLFKNGQILKEFDLPTKYKKSYVSSLFKYDNLLYAGTMGNGILVFNLLTNEFSERLNQNEFEANEQNIIKLQVLNDMLWVGYLNGLKVFNLSNQDLVFDFTDLLKNNYLYTFHAKSANDFYLGTSDNGIIRVENGNAEIEFKDQSVYTIVDTPFGIIFSVEGNGVYIKDKNSIIKLSEQYFLRSNDIYNIFYDEGNFVFAHDQGVDILNWNSKQIKYLSNETLDEPNLNANSFSGSKYLIGYENGLYELQSTLIDELLEEGFVLNPPLLFDEEISSDQNKFEYDENVLTFSFESVNYRAPNERYYKYKLNPLEKEWKTTTQEIVTYYNLPPGQYDFQLSSGGHRNFKTTELKTFSFSISKPFWLLPWFWILVVFILIGLVYLFIKYRENQIIKKEQLKNVQIQYEYQRIKDQINPHFLFNSFNSLIGVVEENPKKSIAVLEKLSDMFRTILKYEKAEVIKLSEELEMAVQYFDIHKIRYQDLIELKIMGISNPEKKFVIPMSLQLLIENAIKHNIINRNNKLQLNISEEQDFLVFTNNVKKKNKNASSLGLGLDNLIKRNEMIVRRRPLIEDTGDFFTVKIPYIYE